MGLEGGAIAGPADPIHAFSHQRRGALLRASRTLLRRGDCLFDHLKKLIKLKWFEQHTYSLLFSLLNGLFPCRSGEQDSWNVVHALMCVKVLTHHQAGTSGKRVIDQEQRRVVLGNLLKLGHHVLSASVGARLAASFFLQDRFQQPGVAQVILHKDNRGLFTLTWYRVHRSFPHQYTRLAVGFRVLSRLRGKGKGQESSWSSKATETLERELREDQKPPADPFARSVQQVLFRLVSRSSLLTGLRAIRVALRIDFGKHKLMVFLVVGKRVPGQAPRF